jgi:hypothetical protein
VIRKHVPDFYFVAAEIGEDYQILRRDQRSNIR